MEDVVFSILEQSLLGGSFIIMLYYFLTKFAQTLDRVASTLETVSLTMSNMDIRMESVERRLETLEKQGREMNG